MLKFAFSKILVSRILALDDHPNPYFYYVNANIKNIRPGVSATLSLRVLGLAIATFKEACIQGECARGIPEPERK